MTETAEQSAHTYRVTAFPAAQKPLPLPVTVAAPIVLDAKTEQGVKPLLDYIASLSQHDNVAVAEAEGQRLQPYFSAMSIYLTRALEKVAPDGTLGDKVNELKELTKPQGLSRLFNAVASYARTTMVSDVVVMTDNVRREGPAQHLFEHWGEFKSDYNYCGNRFNFGFLQVSEGGHRKTARSGTTLPTFMIACQMLEALPPSEAGPLVRDFQAVMTLVNHDMLHHLTSSYIGANTVFKPQERGWSYQDEITEWSRQLPRYAHGEGYEEWAQMGQEKVLLAPGNEALVEEVRTRLDRYMDGLERVRDAALAPDAEGSPSPERVQKAHQVVDYFGMMMAHALTRVFPLNHEMMQHCLDRLKKADPTPDAALRDCAGMMKYPTPEPDATPAQLLADIRRTTVGIPLGREMIKSYRELGCDILPDADGEVGYKNLKMMQLMKLGGLHAHIPAVADPILTKIRANMEDITLQMVVASAKAAKLKMQG